MVPAVRALDGNVVPMPLLHPCQITDADEILDRSLRVYCKVNAPDEIEVAKTEAMVGLPPIQFKATGVEVLVEAEVRVTVAFAISYLRGGTSQKSEPTLPFCQ